MASMILSEQLQVLHLVDHMWLMVKEVFVVTYIFKPYYAPRGPLNENT
jgi:hypothetical protein